MDSVDAMFDEAVIFKGGTLDVFPPYKGYRKR